MTLTNPTFINGAIVRLKSGGPLLTVVRSFQDDRYTDGFEFVVCDYFNTVTGFIVKNVSFPSHTLQDAAQ